jgi:HNH endonuclease
MNPLYSEVARRARHRCEYCRAPEAVFNFPFEVEHILPPGLGGSVGIENCALACRSCNLFKSNAVEAFESIDGLRVRLFQPRLDSWEVHFRVLESGELEALTAIGRVTILQLRMNAAAQIEARRWWVRLAMYPV